MAASYYAFVPSSLGSRWERILMGVERVTEWQTAGGALRGAGGRMCLVHALERESSKKKRRQYGGSVGDPALSSGSVVARNANANAGRGGHIRRIPY